MFSSDASVGLHAWVLTDNGVFGEVPPIGAPCPGLFHDACVRPRGMNG